MLYMTCRFNLENWVCVEGGGAYPLLCDPLWEMLNYCIIANP
jgi:hypothetical protein